MTSPRRKIFVLDTSVLLYDSTAIYNFEEHDVAVPITVLEELDQFKKGDHIVNLQAREIIRELDRISESDPLSGWVPLDGESHGSFRVLAEERASQDARSLFGIALKIADGDNRQIVHQAVSLEVTHLCVCRCRMCNIWKIPGTVPDLPLEKWVALLSEDLLGDLQLFFGQTPPFSPENLERYSADEIKTDLQQWVTEQVNRNQHYHHLQERHRYFGYLEIRLSWSSFASAKSFFIASTSSPSLTFPSSNTAFLTAMRESAASASPTPCTPM